MHSDHPSNDLVSVPNLLQPAIISSFCCTHPNGLITNWPRGIDNIEIYAFMQKSLTSVFKGVFSGKELSSANALRAMAMGFDQGEEDGALEEQVAANIADLSPPRARVVAFATFLPEIMAHPKNQAAWSSAQKALRFLVRVARKMPPPHDVKTIEIVGGSLTAGIWPGKLRQLKPANVISLGAHNDDPYSFVLNRIDRKRAILQLLERLNPVAQEANSEGARINLAIEMEPGPLFTISDESALRILCDRVQLPAYKDLSRVLGLNLDIPHWDFLAGVTASKLRELANTEITQRIVHAHISDHYAKGHFADNGLETFHISERFAEWVELLLEVANTHRPEYLPKFSGYVSLELEACPEEKYLASSARCLSTLIQNANGRFRNRWAIEQHWQRLARLRA